MTRKHTHAPRTIPARAITWPDVKNAPISDATRRAVLEICYDYCTSDMAGEHRFTPAQRATLLEVLELCWMEGAVSRSLTYGERLRRLCEHCYFVLEMDVRIDLLHNLEMLDALKDIRDFDPDTRFEWRISAGNLEIRFS